MEDHMLCDGLIDQLVPGYMGMKAENIAQSYGIDCQECDELALTSHGRATKAIESGWFKIEIVPVEVKKKKKDRSKKKESK